MSSRPKFPEGVEVGQQALAAEPEDRRFHTQRRQVDTMQPGRVAGLDVAIGTPATRFNVSAGYAYTARGDLVEHVGALNLALADYASGIVNYLVLAYREEATNPQAHESDGTTRETLSVRASEVMVLSQSEYDALPVSADADLETNLVEADLATNAQDRMVILATILGKGFTGGSPVTYLASDFENGNIVQNPIPNVGLTAAFVNDPPSISGVNLKSVSGMSAGTVGRLWTDGSEFRWEYPADSATFSPWVAMDPNLDVQDITLSGPGDAEVVIEACALLVPSAGGWDNVNLIEFNEDNHVYTGVDRRHRAQLGSYVPEEGNPHGLGWSDLSQEVAVIHKLLHLGDGLLDTETLALLPRIVTPRSTVAGVDRTLMWLMPRGSYSLRIYRTATNRLELVSNAAWDGDLWRRDDLAVAASRLVMDANAVFFEIHDDGGSTHADGDFQRLWSSAIAGVQAGMTALGEGFLGTATDRTLPRLRTRYSNSAGSKTLLWEAPGPSGGTDQVYRVYGGVAGFEITLNALWNDTALTWSQDNAAFYSMKVQFTSVVPLGRIFYQDPGAPPWADNAWIGGPRIEFDPINGVIAPDFTFYAAQTGRRGIMPASGVVNTGSTGSFSPIGPTLTKVSATGVWQVSFSIIVPNGALLTSIRLGGTFANCSVNVLRVDNAGASQSLISTGAAALSGSGNFDVTLNQNNNVDLLNRGYIIFLTETASGSNSSFTLNLVTVSYTHTQLRP